jgi:hypothetical protein
MDTSKLNKWTDQWLKAQKGGHFGTPEPTEEEIANTQQGFMQSKPKSGFSEIDSKYWNQLYSKSKHPGDAPDPTQRPQVLNEDVPPQPQPLKPDLTNQEKGEIVRGAADSPNPIIPGSVGKDQDYKPNWADVQQLEQLHDMKINLHELESKLNTNDAMATQKGQKIQKQIDSLRLQMDALSDELTPDFLKSYLS